MQQTSSWYIFFLMQIWWRRPSLYPTIWSEESGNGSMTGKSYFRCPLIHRYSTWSMEACVDWNPNFRIEDYVSLSLWLRPTRAGLAPRLSTRAPDAVAIEADGGVSKQRGREKRAKKRDGAETTITAAAKGPPPQTEPTQLAMSLKGLTYSRAANNNNNNFVTWTWYLWTLRTW